jgi:glycosyltransferase involved in cell wall biosynthesis
MGRDRSHQRGGVTRICVAGLRGIPGVMGGVESHCEQLFPRLKAHFNPHDFTLIARRRYVSTNPYYYKGVRVVPLAASRNRYLEAFSNTLFAVLYARFFLRANVLHIHAIGPALLGPLARLLGMKLIVTHHGNDFQRAKWNRFGKMTLRLGAWCALVASNKLVVVSKSVAEELKQRHPAQRDKIEYIPNGATNLLGPGMSAEAHQELLTRYGLEGKKYVIAVGRLVPEKGFHDLLAAFTETDNDFKLVIVGKADHRDSYSDSLLKQASDRVVFAGFQDHPALRILYANASLFVLPSHHEGMPIAALEAAAIGVPLLLSDIAPNRDIGLPPENYFPVGDILALRAKLIADHSSFGVDRDAIAKRFDWDAVAEATAKVYASVIIGRRRKGSVTLRRPFF